MSKIIALLLLTVALVGCNKPNELPPPRSGGGQCEVGKELNWDNCVGKIRYSNGDEYEGGFKGGLVHGKGKDLFANGDKYEGEYKNGHWHGYGIYTFGNGENYDGEWIEGKKHGKGSYNYADGRRFSGYYENNKRYNGKEFNASGELSKEWVSGSIRYVIPEFTLACKMGAGDYWYRIVSKNGEIYFASITNERNILASKRSYKIDVQEREINVEMKEGDSELPYYLEIDRVNLYSVMRYFVSRDLYPPDGFSVMGMSCLSVDEPNMFNVLKQGYKSALLEAHRKKQEIDSRPNKI